MSNKLFRTILLVLVPMVVFATPSKQAAESVQVEVVSSKTDFHGSSPNVFKYTKVMFTRVNGKNIVYACQQKGDECPLMQDGKTYAADRVGDLIYIPMTAPDGKKATPVKYRATTTW